MLVLSCTLIFACKNGTLKQNTQVKYKPRRVVRLICHHALV